MKINLSLSRVTLCVLLSLVLSGCASKDGTAPLNDVTEVNGQLVFDNPQLALETLAQAVRAEDPVKLKQIFGAHAQDLLSSGDPVADRRNIKRVAELIAERTEVVAITNPERPQLAMAGFLFGSSDWPFPVPLVREATKEQGAGWRFDTEAGKSEVVNRRIGENELNVIALCSEYVKAQLEYFAYTTAINSPRFADRFFSSPNKRDGLYWKPAPGEQLSPMGPLVAEAAAEEYMKTTTSPTPFHGYYFRILKSQGAKARGGARNYIANGRMTEGFAMLAYPAKWDVTGSMTYIVGPDSAIYQKNLGADTLTMANKISSYNPDFSWSLLR